MIVELFISLKLLVTLKSVSQNFKRLYPLCVATIVFSVSVSMYYIMIRNFRHIPKQAKKKTKINKNVIQQQQQSKQISIDHLHSLILYSISSPKAFYGYFQMNFMLHISGSSNESGLPVLLTDIFFSIV